MTAQSLPVDECDGADRPAETYSIDELAASAGVTAKQVDHWTRAGLLHPVTRDKATNGVRRRWPEPEVIVCERMALLVDLGLSVPLAHEVARNPGTYVERGVTIRIEPTVPYATPADREVLRAPARAQLAGALRALLGEAEAAVDLLGLDALSPGDVPLHDRWDVDTLVEMGRLVTGSDHEGP